MKVTVKMFGNLRRHLPPGQEAFEVSLPEGASIDAAIAQLGIDDGEVGLTVLNGEMVAESTPLNDGDRLDLIAVMGGGALQSAYEEQ